MLCCKKYVAKAQLKHLKKTFTYQTQCLTNFSLLSLLAKAKSKVKKYNKKHHKKPNGNTHESKFMHEKVRVAHEVLPDNVHLKL